MSRAADFILKLAKLKEKVKLRQHQEDAVDYVLEGDGSALLAHGTGSGKTLSAIAAFEKLRELNKAKRALVLTPASLQDNFETEGVGKFTDSQVSRGVDGKSPYQIMSYSKFRRDPHRYLQESKADTVIADEVHRAKDKQSVTYRALRTASNYVDNFIGLTGSPISNHPREIVPLMDLVAPTHDLGSQQGFQKRHTKREMYDKGGFLRGPKFRTELQRKVELSGKVKGKVHYLGHEDLTQDMPGLDIREIHTEMTPEQTKLYNFALGKLTPRQRRLIRDGLPASQSEAQHILSAIMKARQASNSVGTHKDIPLHQAAEETPKLKQVMDDVQEHLRNTSDGQAVIYTNLVQGGADALYAGLKKRGLNPGLFAGVGALGEVTKDSRQKAVEDFRSGKKNVILLTPAAGEGVSLNNATFFAEVDRHYNPERNQQAIARGRRLGGLAHRPKSNRVLEVRRYYSDPKPNWFRRILGQTEMGVDSWIQTVADEKDRLNRDFRKVVKTASELPTQEEIFSLLSKKLPQGVQHVSGGLADTKGVSDVDGGMYHEDHTNLLHQFPEGTEISEQSPEGTVYSIPGYQRDVNIYATSNADRVREAHIHRNLSLELERRFPRLAEEARRLKLGGMKTEPAWAKVLGLSGDPYKAMANKDLVFKAAMEKVGSQQPPKRPTAVIVEGNPEGKGREGSELYKFYDELQQFVQDQGFDVTRDLGLSKTMPPKADVWIGHSRGNDRLGYADPSQKGIRMGSPHADSITDKWDRVANRLRQEHIQKNNLHWPDVPFDEREKLHQQHLQEAIKQHGPIPEGKTPHMMLTEEMKEELAKRLGGIKTASTVGRILDSPLAPHVIGLGTAGAFLGAGNLLDRSRRGEDSTPGTRFNSSMGSLVGGIGGVGAGVLAPALAALALQASPKTRALERIVGSPASFATAAALGGTMGALGGSRVAHALHDKEAAVYHGSPHGDIQQLEPRPSAVIDNEEAVFATPHKGLALSFLARWRDPDFIQGTINKGPLVMRERYPGAFEKIYGGKSGYLYTLPEEGFRADDRLMSKEVINPEAVTPERVEHIQDILKAMGEAGVIMKKHDDPVEWEIENAPLKPPPPHLTEQEKNASDAARRKLISIIEGVVPGFRKEVPKILRHRTGRPDTALLRRAQEMGATVEDLAPAYKFSPESASDMGLGRIRSKELWDFETPISYDKKSMSFADIDENYKRLWSGRHAPRPGETLIPASHTAENVVSKGSDTHLFRGNPFSESLLKDPEALPGELAGLMSRHPDVAAGYAQGTSFYQHSGPGTGRMFAYKRGDTPVLAEGTADFYSRHRGKIPESARDRKFFGGPGNMLNPQAASALQEYEKLNPPKIDATGAYGRLRQLQRGKNTPTYESVVNMKEVAKPVGEYTVRKSRTPTGQPAFAVKTDSGTPIGELLQEKNAAVGDESKKSTTPITNQIGSLLKKVRPGDVIVTKPSEAGGKGFVNRGVHWYTSTFFDKPWLHAGLVGTDKHVVQTAFKLDRKGRKVHGLDTGTRQNVHREPIKDYLFDNKDVLILRPKKEEHGWRALARMRSLIDKVPYDWGDFTRTALPFRGKMTPEEVKRYNAKAPKSGTCHGTLSWAFDKVDFGDTSRRHLRADEFVDNPAFEEVVAYSPDKTAAPAWMKMWPSLGKAARERFATSLGKTVQEVDAIAAGSKGTRMSQALRGGGDTAQSLRDIRGMRNQLLTQPPADPKRFVAEPDPLRPMGGSGVPFSSGDIRQMLLDQQIKNTPHTYTLPIKKDILGAAVDPARVEGKMKPTALSKVLRAEGAKTTAEDIKALGPDALNPKNRPIFIGADDPHKLRRVFLHESQERAATQMRDRSPEWFGGLQNRALDNIARNVNKQRAALQKQYPNMAEYQHMPEATTDLMRSALEIDPRQGILEGDWSPGGTHLTAAPRIAEEQYSLRFPEGGRMIRASKHGERDIRPLMREYGDTVNRPMPLTGRTADKLTIRAHKQSNEPLSMSTPEGRRNTFLDKNASPFWSWARGNYEQRKTAAPAWVKQIQRLVQAGDHAGAQQIAKRVSDAGASPRMIRELGKGSDAYAAQFAGSLPGVQNQPGMFVHKTAPMWDRSAKEVGNVVTEKQMLDRLLGEQGAQVFDRRLRTDLLERPVGGKGPSIAQTPRTFGEKIKSKMRPKKEGHTLFEAQEYLPREGRKVDVDQVMGVLGGEMKPDSMLMGAPSTVIRTMPKSTQARLPSTVPHASTGAPVPTGKAALWDVREDNVRRTLGGDPKIIDARMDVVRDQNAIRDSRWGMQGKKVKTPSGFRIDPVGPREIGPLRGQYFQELKNQPQVQPMQNQQPIKKVANVLLQMAMASRLSPHTMQAVGNMTNHMPTQNQMMAGSALADQVTGALASLPPGARSMAMQRILMGSGSKADMQGGFGMDMPDLPAIKYASTKAPSWLMDGVGNALLYGSAPLAAGAAAASTRQSAGESIGAGTGAALGAVLGSAPLIAARSLPRHSVAQVLTAGGSLLGIPIGAYFGDRLGGDIARGLGAGSTHVEKNASAARSAAIEKVAVTLEQLRKAYKAGRSQFPMERKIVSNTFGPIKWKDYQQKSKWDRLFDSWSPAANVKRPDQPFLDRVITKAVEGKPPELADAVRDQIIKATEHLPARSTIVQEGDMSKMLQHVGIPKSELPTSPAGKEMLNRGVFMHEVREAQPHKGVFNFASHRTIEPMLQDMNIAATATGPGGAETARAFRALRRPEVDQLAEVIGPDVRRLNLGVERMSRHGRKRLQESYDRAVLKNLRGRDPIEAGKVPTSFEKLDKLKEQTPVEPVPIFGPLPSGGPKQRSLGQRAKEHLGDLWTRTKQTLGFEPPPHAAPRMRNFGMHNQPKPPQYQGRSAEHINRTIKTANINKEAIWANLALNYGGNTARESRNPRVERFYDRGAARTFREGVSGKRTHPFLRGMFHSSPFSQFFDPWDTAEGIGGSLRGLLQELPPEDRAGFLTEVQNLVKELGPENLPSEYRPLGRVLASMDPTEVSAWSQQGPSKVRAALLPKTKGGEVAAKLTGNLAGGILHLGTGGKPISDFDASGFWGASASDYVDHKAKGGAKAFVDKLRGGVHPEATIPGNFIAGATEGSLGRAPGANVFTKHLGRLFPPAIRSAIEQGQAAGDLLGEAIKAAPDDVRRGYTNVQAGAEQVRGAQSSLHSELKNAPGKIRAAAEQVQQRWAPWSEVAQASPEKAYNKAYSAAESAAHQGQAGLNRARGGVRDATKAVDSAIQQGQAVLDTVRSVGQGAGPVGQHAAYSAAHHGQSALDALAAKARMVPQAGESVIGHGQSALNAAQAVPDKARAAVGAIQQQVAQHAGIPPALLQEGIPHAEKAIDQAARMVAPAVESKTTLQQAARKAGRVLGKLRGF